MEYELFPNKAVFKKKNHILWNIVNVKSLAWKIGLQGHLGDSVS